MGRRMKNTPSYVLGSIPRTVFVLQSASDDPEEDRVVWTCCKNNDGELGQRSAWQRRNVPVHRPTLSAQCEVEEVAISTRLKKSPRRSTTKNLQHSKPPFLPVSEHSTTPLQALASARQTSPRVQQDSASSDSRCLQRQPSNLRRVTSRNLSTPKSTIILKKTALLLSRGKSWQEDALDSGSQPVGKVLRRFAVLHSPTRLPSVCVNRSNLHAEDTRGMGDAVGIRHVGMRFDIGSSQRENRCGKPAKFLCRELSEGRA
jgi:hypothetical protein